MEASNILSMKVSRTKNDQTITIDYFVPELNRNRTEEINDVPHQDFNKALLNLSPYLAHVFHSDNENYVATGFKYTSNDKVIITGKLSTESGSIVGISTPAIDDNNHVYGFELDFFEDLQKLVLETMDLLTGKKVGVKQLTIDDSIQQNESDVESEPEYSEEENDENEPVSNDEFLLPE